MTSPKADTPMNGSSPTNPTPTNGFSHSSDVQAQDAATQARFQRVLMMSIARSASNLLSTMLSKQPNHDSSGYYNLTWMQSWLNDLEKGPFDTLPATDREERERHAQQNFEKILADMEATEKNGRRSLIKEHVTLLLSPNNFFDEVYPSQKSSLPPSKVHTPGASSPESYTTCLSVPDAFLLTCTPVFTIRHPALMYASLARAMAKATGSNTGGPRATAVMTLSWTRSLYEWYVAHGIEPCVMDADDVMKNPGAMRELCVRTGMEPDAVVFDWERREVPPKDADPLMAGVFLSTIYASTGVVQGKDSAGVDVEAEKVKFKEEFGEKWGMEIGERVDMAMGDYKYLWERRVKGEGY